MPRKKTKKKSGLNIFREQAGPSARKNRSYINRSIRHNKEKFNQINSDLNDINLANKSKIDSIRDDLNSKTSEFQSSLNKSSTNIKLLKGMVDDQNATLEGKINSVQSKVSGFTKKIDTAESMTKSMNSKIDSNDSNLKSKLQTAITAVNQTIADVENNSKKRDNVLKEEIKTLRKSLTDKIDKNKNESHEKITNLTKKLDDLRGEVNKLPKSMIGNGNGKPGPPGPKGDQGAKGDEGARGAKGAKGDKGDQGDKGDIGIVGERGRIGLQGRRGEQGMGGEKGIVGERGRIGFQGRRGEKGMGGEQGIVGERGRIGFQGRRGEKGIEGQTYIPDNVFDPTYLPASEELRKIYLKNANEPTPGELSLLSISKIGDLAESIKNMTQKKQKQGAIEDKERSEMIEDRQRIEDKEGLEMIEDRRRIEDKERLEMIEDRRRIEDKERPEMIEDRIDLNTEGGINNFKKKILNKYGPTLEGQVVIIDFSKELGEMINDMDSELLTEKFKDYKELPETILTDIRKYMDETGSETLDLGEYLDSIMVEGLIDSEIDAHLDSDEFMTMEQFSSKYVDESAERLISEESINELVNDIINAGKNLPASSRLDLGNKEVLLMNINRLKDPDGTLSFTKLEPVLNDIFTRIPEIKENLLKKTGTLSIDESTAIEAPAAIAALDDIDADLDELLDDSPRPESDIEPAQLSSTDDVLPIEDGPPIEGQSDEGPQEGLPALENSPIDSQPSTPPSETQEYQDTQLSSTEDVLPMEERQPGEGPLSEGPPSEGPQEGIPALASPPTEDYPEPPDAGSGPPDADIGSGSPDADIGSGSPELDDAAAGSADAFAAADAASVSAEQSRETDRNQSPNNEASESFIRASQSL